MFFTAEAVAAGLPEQELAEARRTGRSAVEGWRLRKSGERFWGSFVLTSMIDRGGQHVGFAKVMRDMTELKRQEVFAMDMALREERDKMRAVAESSMDALFLCDALRNAQGHAEDFIFTYLNQKVEALTGIPRLELLGRPLSQLELGDGADERNGALPGGACHR